MRRLALTALAVSTLAVAAAAQPGTAARPEPQSLTDIEQTLSKLDGAERELRRHLVEIAAETKISRARVLLCGRRYAKMARAGLLPVGGGFDALVDHASSLERLRRSIARDFDRIRALDRKKALVLERLSDLADVKKPLEGQRQSMDRARAALLAQEDRALAFKRAFEQSSGVDHTAIYGSPMGPGDPAMSASGFAAMRGRLPFPVAGRAEIRSARRGAEGPGLEMVAPRGTPVRAVFPGRIGFADEYSEYGKTVIIDHGDSHFTVSANLSEISVKVGDEVTQGTRIGSIGNDGTGPKLYLEIRVGSETVDPAEWFGI